MKTLLKRKYKNQPCRSPSPDIANKSIIKNTVIEIEDIRTKIKKVEERQIKFQLDNSANRISGQSFKDFELRYKQMFDQLNKTKQQNTNLLEQIKLLNEQNKRISLKQQRNTIIDQFSDALLSKKQNQKLKQKNNKLQKQLYAQRIKYEQAYKMIQSLHLQLSKLKQQPKTYQNPRERSTSGNQYSQNQYKLINLSNNLIKNYESKLTKQLEQMNMKINRLQMKQKILKEQLNRVKSENKNLVTPTSNKAVDWINSTVSGGYGSTVTKQFKGSAELPSSPIQRQFDQSWTIQRLKNQKDDLSEQIQIKNDEIKGKSMYIKELLQENEKLNQIIKDTDRQKSKISTPKFNTGQQSLFKKVFTLQQSLRNYKTHIQQLQLQNRHHLQTISVIKNHSKQQIDELITKITQQQKIIQYLESQLKSPFICQNCSIKDNQTIRLKRQLNQLEVQYNNNLTRLNQQFQNDIDSYNQQLELLKRTSNQRISSAEERYIRLDQLYQAIQKQLKQYVEVIEFLKQQLKIEDIEQILRYNFNIYTESYDYVNSLRSQYEIIINEYHQNLILKQQENIQYERQLNIKIRQIQSLHIQIEKLRSIKRDIPQISRVSSILESKHQVFSENNRTIIEKIQQNRENIDNLHQKISKGYNFVISSYSQK